MPEDRRGELGWGDAIAAAARLSLTAAEDFDALVHLVGLRIATADTPADVPAADPDPDPRDQVVRHGMPTGAGQPPDQDDLPVPRDRRTLVEELKPLPVDAFASTAVPLEPLGSPTATVRYEPPVPTTLLRAAMTMLVRRERPSDLIDLEEVIDSIIEQRALVALPRLLELSTRLGVAVVADVGASMLPYLADVRAFVAELEHVVGASNTVVAWVDHDRYRPDRMADVAGLVALDRPILVISTLGAARPPGSSVFGRLRWLEFARAARQCGSDVVALTPHRLRSWPDDIAHSMRVVAWDDLPRVGRGRG